MKRVILLSFVALGWNGPAPAAEEAAAKPPDVAWSFSGEFRFRPEYRSDFDLERAVDDERRQGFMRLRLGVGATIRDDVRLLFQAQDSRIAGEEASTLANHKNTDLHQGYAEIRRLGVAGLTLTIGRQELKYGDERLIGATGWDNVGRAFDGVKIRFAPARYFLDGFYARISNGASATATQGMDLYGIEYQATLRESGEYGAYWLDFVDNAQAAGETGVPGSTSIHALGGRVKDRFGRFDVNAELAFETGEFRGDDLRAFAGALQAGGTWGEAVKTRAFVGYDHATGDEASTDGERQEFFNFFPTNHQHYGYADFWGWRNIASPYVGVSFTSGKHFGQVKLHDFSLEEAGGPWKDAGGTVLGFDSTASSGEDVGRELDLTYRYRWMDKVTLEAGYSRFDPDSFAEAQRGPDASDWGYLMLTFGF